MRRLVGAVVCGAAGMALAGCVHTVGGTASSASGTSGASGALGALGGGAGGGLDGVLLGADQVNAVMSATGIAVVDNSQNMQTSTENVSRPDCLGALYNAQDSVYRNSGWTDVRDQVLQGPSGNSAHRVEQTAVEFPGSDPALAFVNASLAAWSRCSGKEVTMTAGSDVNHWKIGDLVITGRTINQTALQEDAGGWGCQHALSAVAAIVVEATACSNNIADQAVTIIDKMSAKVP
ncbi:MAG: sensor domain-containing protein [Mycolicibacterium sp.]|nr:sensor domain-containing protein [Mycolicibacterium sp.]